MRAIRKWRMLQLLAFACVPALPAQDRLEVTALMVDNEPKTSVDQIKYLPFGSFKSEPMKDDTTVGDGDELSCADTKCLVVLSGTSEGDIYKITLSGGFRAVFLKTGSKLEKVALLSGTADVETTGPTVLESGETVLASERTSYRATATREQGAGSAKWFLFEGAATVKSQSSTWKMVPGKRCTLDPLEAFKVSEISAEDFSRAATAYERADVGIAARKGVQLNYAQRVRLRARHYAVLKNPADLEHRLALGAVQAQLHNLDAARLQLYRMDRDKRPDSRSDDSKTNLLQAFILDKEGRSADAARKYATALEQDSAVTEKFLKAVFVPKEVGERLKKTSDVQRVSDRRYGEVRRHKNRIGDYVPRYEENIRSSTATSRDFYDLARVYGLNDRKADAQKISVEALARHLQDRKLDSTALGECWRLALPYGERLALGLKLEPLGHDLLRSKLREEAVQCFELLSSSRHASSRSFYGLALAQRALKKRRDAMRSARTAIRMNKSDKALKPAELRRASKIARTRRPVR